MKKTLLSIALTSLFFVSFSILTTAARAQSVEEGDVAFTPYFPKFKCTNCMPAISLESLSPSERPTFVASPNPSYDGIIKVWYDKLIGASELVILDANGKQYFRASVGSDRQIQGVQSLDVTSFASGLYFFCLRSGAYQAVQKVIIR